MPLASNAEELKTGYGDVTSKTYYKLANSKKINSFPFPLPSV